jgi:all-trans-8'-apo-beta-carotenal 15,15'-oxygenase
VRYQNAFVHTAKFVEEEKADAFRFSTWSMRRPGGMLANLGGGPVRSQAGVTVYPFNDKLYAFDEVSPAYGLDPATLATLGEEELGDPAREFMIKAHTKFDPLTSEWLLFGISHGATMKLHMIVHGSDGALKAHHVVPSPRQIYIHDFLATRNHFAFVLHPIVFSPWRFLRYKGTPSAISPSEGASRSTAVSSASITARARRRLSTSVPSPRCRQPSLSVCRARRHRRGAFGLERGAGTRR